MGRSDLNFWIKICECNIYWASTTDTWKYSLTAAIPPGPPIHPALSRCFFINSADLAGRKVAALGCAADGLPC